MAFKFTDAGRYPYEPGGFFLGVDDHGREIGIRSERHLITVAGAGSGKGAALIVPNLKRWRGSCVVVDPKGENATITAGERASMGQLVGVVDPYRIAKGDAAGLRCSINPLAVMNPESLTIRADLEALGDGLIRRFDPKHAQWDNTAALICAGLADYVLSGPPERRNLLEVRKLLLLPDDLLKELAEEMLATPTAARLAKDAGSSILNKFSNSEGVPASAFERAKTETGWIDDPAFAAILGGDDLPAFDLAALKAGAGSLYLCIPPGYLDTRGGFLRLFVRMGLMTMMSDLAEHGSGEGRCLFLLDEFHSLGKMELVAKAAGLMRGYGVQLWPFLQDLGQLAALYGRDEMGTFFGNADAHIFFGNTDADTLDHISRGLGVWTQKDIGAVPPTQSALALDPARRSMAYDPIHAPAPIASSPTARQGIAAPLTIVGAANFIQREMHKSAITAQAQERQAIEREEKELAFADANAMRAYQDKMAKKGEPFVTPQEVRELVAKRDGEAVARSMVVFAKGGDKLNIRLAPYFRPLPPVVAFTPEELAAKITAWNEIEQQAAGLIATAETARRGTIRNGGILLLVFACFTMFTAPLPLAALLVCGAAIVYFLVAVHALKKRESAALVPRAAIAKARHERSLLEPMRG